MTNGIERSVFLPLGSPRVSCLNSATGLLWYLFVEIEPTHGPPPTHSQEQIEFKPPQQGVNVPAAAPQTRLNKQTRRKHAARGPVVQPGILTASGRRTSGLQAPSCGAKPPEGRGFKSRPVHHNNN